MVEQVKREKSYIFDHVFAANDTTEDVFVRAVRPVMDKLMNGFNTTIFAYGQTGAGKVR